MAKKFCIAAQAVALPLKTEVQKHLESLGYEVVDLVPADEQPTISFTGVAEYVGRAIQSGEYEKGFVFCGTGMGVSMVVNKYKGVRAALVESPYAARMSRIINDANVLCMGQWIFTPHMACETVNEFVNHSLLDDEDPAHPNEVRIKRLTDGIAFVNSIGEE
ncbi:MAG: RpiB/LacA/LacB family sugar-phosphate isomerase [Lachnospiraceae bacterium]|nr:RpiB/LacA/LacB family sugar-phosphate isomerase [Lachnospiraceae bacterium]MBR0153756.1 RpiB/LacA/LacB family sugar-phosphate isomerase [Lachnospiraceae bacterium]